MKNERLFEALEKIDEELIDEAAPGNKPPKKSKKNIWIMWGATAACAVLIVGISIPYIWNRDGNLSGGGMMEETNLEGNISDAKTENGVSEEAGEGETNLVTLTHMEEIRIRIDEMFPDGFRGTIEVETDLFKEGEQITIVALENVTVVLPDGSIFDYNELEPNIKESDLAVGSSVWVGFQSYDYVDGNGKYNQIFAYHVEASEIRENNGVKLQDTADEGFPNWGLTLSVKDVTASGLTLVCTQSGGELTGELETGSDYKLIVLKEAWEDVPTIIEDYGWTAEAYMVARDDVTEFEYNWKWLYGELPAGTYRMVKGFTDFRGSGDYDNFVYWIEFEIK